MNIRTSSFDSVPAKKGLNRKQMNSRTTKLLDGLNSLAVKQKLEITPDSSMTSDEAKRYLTNIQQDIYKLKPKLMYNPVVRRSNNLLEVYRIEGSDYATDADKQFIRNSDGARMTVSEVELQTKATSAK